MVKEKKIDFKNKQSYRMINSKFPPITLFDDVVDAEDFESAYALQALTNPRILDQLGDINLIDNSEIPFGIEGVNYVTAPFTHVNVDGSRFSDGTFGMLYLADCIDTAIAETKFHQEKYLKNIVGINYDTIDMRCIKVVFSAELIDSTENEEIHDPDDYSYSRVFGKKIKKKGMPGIHYRSVRNKDSICWGLMSPIFIESAIQTKHFEFIFDGNSISNVRELAIG